MNIKAFIQNIFFLIPIALTSLVYLRHSDGDGSGLVLYGKPNQTLGISLFTFQIVLTLILLIFFRLYKKGNRSPFIFLFKSFLFLVSLGVPVFINDWIYCGIFCYMATFSYTVLSACILALVFIFCVYKSITKPVKHEPSQTSLQV